MTSQFIDPLGVLFTKCFSPVTSQGHGVYLSHLQTKLLHSKFLEIFGLSSSGIFNN